MGIKSIIMVAVLAMSSTSFASYNGVAAGPKAPCPKIVAMMKTGMKGLLGWTSSAQQQFNSRILASNSSSGARKQAPSAAPSGTQGKSIR